MRLDLRFSDRPLDSLWCQAITALVFQEPDVSFSPFYELNEKFSGYLGELADKGLWTGEKGENLLLASQDRIQSDKLLFHGLGRRGDFSISILENEVGNLGIMLNKIKVSDFSIYVPVLNGLETKYPSFLESSAIQLVNSFYKYHQEEPEYYLKVVFSVESGFLNILSALEIHLREYFTPMLDFSIIVDRHSISRGSEATG